MNEYRDSAQAPDQTQDWRRPAWKIERRQPERGQEDDNLLHRIALYTQGIFQLARSAHGGGIDADRGGVR